MPVREQLAPWRRRSASGQEMTQNATDAPVGDAPDRGEDCSVAEVAAAADCLAAPEAYVAATPAGAQYSLRVASSAGSGAPSLTAAR